MSEVSRNIPAAVKRPLRQEAGFGCCICGHPFFEYHHILPFSEIPHHNPNDMMLLCPTDHHQATVNALDESTQRKAKNNSFNISHGYTHGQLMVNDEFVAVEVGTNYLVGSGFKFLVDDEPLLQINKNSNGRLSITSILYDEEDHEILCIVDNEWITGDTQPWDFEFEYNRLKLRLGIKDIALFIDARKSPLEISGKFWRKKQNFIIKKDGLFFNRMIKDSGFVNLSLVGAQLNADTVKSKFLVSPSQGLKEFFVVNNPDPVEKLAQSLQAYKELLKKTGVRRNDLCLCGSGKKFLGFPFGSLG